MLTRSTRPWMGWLVAGALLWLASGCDESRPQRTDLFERAEQNYRRGEYDTALDQYQAFINQYPRSALADTARLRMRSLTREVEAMLDRKDMPQPLYVGDRGDRSLPPESTERPADPSTSPSQSPRDE